MKRVYVNEEWCLGCHLCEYHCAFAATGGDNMSLALKGKEIHPNIRVEQRDNISFAVSCRHCNDPLCVKSCITGALSKKDGVISVDRNKCVGCYTCILACPYGAIARTEAGPIQKCELCLRTAEGSPRCVQGCLNGAIVYEERE